MEKEKRGLEVDSKNIKILVADDEPSILSGVKAVLLSEGYDVLTAKNGKEAVEIFKKESPDLVILDVSMPHLSGFEVLDRIKKYFGERYIPVIFLTVSVKIDDKLRALHGGAVDYLTKPASPEELLARIRNFIEIKEKHDGLKKAATYDWMTGALNKAHFVKKAKEELEKAVRNKTPLSFIFMDIDRFKKINDEIGHLAGDKVISEFANRLKKLIRRIDLIGRFGGDEFMLMLPHKGKKEALIVADRLIRDIKTKTIIFEKHKIPLSASMGIISLKTDKKIDISSLIKLADEALYEAKAKGGNCHVIKTLL